MHNKIDKKKDNSINTLVFLCGARDFHAMDWYRSAQKIIRDKKIIILTDLIAGEGFKKIIVEQDHVVRLLILDKFLFRKQSHIGDIWRNILKLLVFPIQVYLLRQFSKKNANAIYHAHSMYYLFLAWAAKVPFVGTPQGSDVLIKPDRSKLFRFFAIKSLRAAKCVTVDSEKMRQKILEIANVNAEVIQNGIDVNAIALFKKQNNINPSRFRILSIRGFTSLYRIGTIIRARNTSSKNKNSSLTLIYPFYEEQYKADASPAIKSFDSDLGRVDRNKMYELLLETKLVVSIPISDSSPRSVYEAIFCGCAVAITYNTYIEALPDCMRSRIIVIDIDDNNWLDYAIERAESIVNIPYSPSERALDMFDQVRSFQKMQKILFS